MNFNDLVSDCSDILSEAFGEDCRVIFSDGTSKKLTCVCTPKEDNLSINTNVDVVDYTLALSFKISDIPTPDDVEIIVFRGKEYFANGKHDFRIGFVKFFLNK